MSEEEEKINFHKSYILAIIKFKGDQYWLKIGDLKYIKLFILVFYLFFLKVNK